MKFDKALGPYKKGKKFRLQLKKKDKVVEERFFDTEELAVKTKLAINRRAKGLPPDSTATSGSNRAGRDLLWESLLTGDDKLITAMASGCRALVNMNLYVNDQEDGEQLNDVDKLSKEDQMALLQKRMDERKLRVVNASDDE